LFSYSLKEKLTMAVEKVRTRKEEFTLKDVSNLCLDRSTSTKRTIGEKIKGVDYYKQTCKLYLANVVLTTQVNHFVINVLANIHGFSLKN